jgi:hypothetical protein
MPTPSQSLAQVRVRLIVSAEERRQWDEAMVTWHYLKNARMVGEQLRYVAEVNGVWVALLGWCAATLKSAPRRAWIGWDVVQERQRLHLVANNARFVMLGVRVPHLASRILALNRACLSRDWEESYGHPVLLAETFVDSARYRGTCYRAAGWEEIGQTQGVAREVGGWRRHSVRKTLLVIPLRRDARDLLCSDHQDEDRPPRLTPQEIRLSGDDGLLEILRCNVPDPRGRKGRRFPFATLLGLLVAGMLADVTNVECIAAWVRGLPPAVLKRFRCPRWPDGGYRVPCANSYRYLLQEIDPLALDRAIRTWLRASGINDSRVVIAIDGKTLRGSAQLDQPARKAVSFFLVGMGITIAQQEIPATTSEVPHARTMMTDTDLNIDRSIITADAAHTCPDTANTVVKKGATSSSRSKAINPAWRLRWSNISKPPQVAPTRPTNTHTPARNTANSSPQQSPQANSATTSRTSGRSPASSATPSSTTAADAASPSSTSPA